MNLIMALVDKANEFKIGIDAYMILPATEDFDWISMVESGSDYFALQVHVDNPGTQELADDETALRCNLYGNGYPETLAKLEELKDRFCWDKFGASFHFTSVGMIDDIVPQDTPMPVPSDLDRVSLCTATFVVTHRDK